jgi:hypothetical protein
MDACSDGMEVEVIEEGVAPPACVGSTEPTLARPSNIFEVLRSRMADMLQSGDDSDLTQISRLARPRASSASVAKRKDPPTPNIEPQAKRPRAGSEPTTVTPASRALQFASEGFIVSAGSSRIFRKEKMIINVYFLGSLFCSHCRKEVALKLSTIKDHIGDPNDKKLNKHQQKKIETREARKKQSDMVAFVEVHSLLCRPLSFPNEILSPFAYLFLRPASRIRRSRKVRVRSSRLNSFNAYRLEVLETTLRAGDPVERIDVYRPLLERGGQALTAASHMRQLIPLLALRYQTSETSRVKARHCSVIFDGTDHFGELLLVYVRIWEDEKWTDVLVRLRHSDAPLDNRSLQFILDRALHRVGIAPIQVLAFVKDTVAVNFLAVGNLIASSGYTLAKNLPCWSHNFARIGKQFKFEYAMKFIKLWSSYFSMTLRFASCSSWIPLPFFSSSIREKQSGECSKWQPTARTSCR